MRIGLLTLLLLTGGLPAETLSLRSTELIRYECIDRGFRRDITLFGNGTVRLREGPLGRQSLQLADLDEKELQEILKQVVALDLSETQEVYEGMLDAEEGSECLVRLDPAGRQEIAEYRFGPYAAVSLALSQLVEIAETLGRRTRDPDAVDIELPETYEPKPGDVLLRFDGVRFEVLGLSEDRLHLELEGVDQPLTLVVPLADLGEVFDSLELHTRAADRP